MFAKSYNLKLQTVKYISIFLLLLVAGLFISSCGSSPEAQTEKNKLKQESIAGESDHQKVKIKNKRTKIILNDDENSEDSYIVIRKGSRHNFDSVRIDMSHLKKELDEMADELRNLKINVDFNGDELRETLSNINIDVAIDSSLFEGLKGLNKELVRIKIRRPDSLTSLIDEEELREIRMHFNSKEFKEEMKNLEKELEKTREELASMNIDIEMMSEDIARDAKNLSEELMENMDFDLDIDINIDKAKLKEDVKRAKEELESLDIDLENINEFTDEITVELRDDNLLKNKDEGYTLEFDYETVYLDGKKLPEKSAQKYREIFKRYFDRYPEQEEIRTK